MKKKMNLAVIVVALTVALCACSDGKKEINISEPSTLIGGDIQKSTASEETQSIEPSISDAQEIEELVTNFSNAYFAGDVDDLKQYLTDSYNNDIEVYYNLDTADEVVINEIKGLENIVESDMNDEYVISIEYRESKDDDSFKYLTIDLIKVTSGWRVQFYAIEM